MSVAEAYGPNTELVDRLLADCRVMGPSGVERIAWGTRLNHADFHQAEAAAADAVASHGLEPAWQAAQDALRGMMEGSSSTLAWRAEDDTTRRTAEDAALHAGLALVARAEIDHEVYRTLVKPMSEALPWLLPEEPPDQYRGGGAEAT